MPSAITGFDATLRRVLTPVAVGAALTLAAVAVARAVGGEMIGLVGSVLVMTVTGAVALKFAAEAYLFSHLSAEESPRERAAHRMIEQHGALTKARFALGALGGVVLPLGVQILSAGLKDIQPVNDPVWPAAIACLAAALLLPGEYAERKLWRLTTDEQ